MPTTLPFKDQAIRSATYAGSGRETEFRIKGHPGLIFVVQRPGKDGMSTKCWRAYYSRIEGGRQIKRKKRLGKYPGVSLAEARRLAAEVAEAVEKGRDPVAEVHAQRAQRERDGLTLADLIADYIEDQTRSGVATVREVERALNRDIVPALGHLRPAEITDLQIESVIDGVAKRGKAMARHLLVYLRGAYNHALRGSPQLRHRYGLTHNPADNVGRGRRGKPGKYGRPPVDSRYLSDAEIPLFWHALDQSGTDLRTVMALKLLLLTGQRPGEVVGARIAELDLRSATPTWQLPAERTKNGLPHIVPLAPLAAILFTAAVGGRTAGSVFPSQATGDGVLGEATVRQAVSRLFEKGRLTCPNFSPKDLRTTVKTGMAALRIPREIRDAVENHKPEGIGDRAYNFHDYADEKREALETWAKHVTKLLRSGRGAPQISHADGAA